MVKTALCTLALLLGALVSAQGSQWTVSRGSNISSPSEGRKAEGGLPDGHVATTRGGTIAKAWYTEPTRRYRHGILGDAIEAGGLKIALRSGKTLTLSLPKNLVFEDRTPRLHDLDGDGKTEIVTLLSSRSKGAAIAVYGARGGKIHLIDQTSFIGRSNRWRNIAGIADYNGDGAAEIAEVVTPHIGGTLKFWTWRNRRLKLAGSMRSFSNHAIGSREQKLSASADFNGDGVVDIAIPGSNRKNLRLMGFVKRANNSRKLQEISRINLRTSISTSIQSRSRGGKTKITVGLSDGSVWDIQN